MKTRRHVRVRGILFTNKEGDRKLIKQLRTMKQAVKNGYSVVSITNARVLKAKKKDDLYYTI